MPTGFLRASAEKVVDDCETPVMLRGAGLGGWMNMENFITGYPGSESQHRAAMGKALGPEKYEFFFEKFLDHFFTEADAKFLASKGLNCLRVPFNYHHFEDDMNPRVLREEGFKHLDQVVDLCAREGIYTILDMHTVPGGQNPDWHSDNCTNYAAFWDHKDFQDRTVWLWEQLAAHYRDNPNVAEKAIRAIDPNHMLWLDGNTMAMEWRFFDNILPNCVYALHDYTTMGFPWGETYTATSDQKAKLEQQFLRKAQFMIDHKVPCWNGEFGPVYAQSYLDGGEAEAEAINKSRYEVLGEQLRIYDKYKIHWTIWLYKDIGMQGMVHLSPTSPYMSTIAPFIQRKIDLQLDAWGRRPNAAVNAVIHPLVDWINKVAPNSNDQYPTPWNTERQMIRVVNQMWLAGCLQDEFAGLFKGLEMEELEACAKSFRIEECVQRDGLNRILEEHASVIEDSMKGMK